jgi:glutaredoxin
MTLYTTHCPKCIQLEQKLKEHNLDYTVIDDVQVMLDKGIMSAPVLEVNNECLPFFKAMAYITSLN